MSVSTARRLNQIPSRRSINTSLRLALALIVSISYSFIYIEAAGSRGFPCAVNTWGPECKECLCENNATCSPNNGICTCTQGWEGQYCNKKICDHRHYGDKCQHSCSCFNGASCHPVTGECLCSAGYRGVNCNTTCPEGTYGFMCKKDCTCPINTVCSPIDGSCTCKYKFEYNGTHCECRPKNSIPGCEACNCSQLGTCNLTTGECMCQVGYTGESCRKLHCGDKHYVPGCHGNCNCQYNATCYERDWSCDCLPGWAGKSCNDSCPDGRYGKNCQSKCTCENRSSCDPVTGKCDCLPGWTGKSCNDSCPDGRYGINCQSKCTCENRSSCDPVTGKCDCLPGWTGKSCNDSCPDGRYGINCLSKCTCENSTSCDPQTGRCGDLLTTYTEESKRALIIAVVVIVVILTIIVCPAFYIMKTKDISPLSGRHNSNARSDDLQEHSTEQITENRTVERSRGARESYCRLEDITENTALTTCHEVQSGSGDPQEYEEEQIEELASCHSYKKKAEYVTRKLRHISWPQYSNYRHQRNSAARSSSTSFINQALINDDK